jgi:hypothetical protein
MNLETIFSAVSTLSFFSWIALWFFYRNPKVYTYLLSVVLLIFAVTYSYFLLTGISFGDMENFQTLEGVKALFSSDEAVLAGWIHYLAFDLFVGMWIASDAAKHHLSKWILLPFLFFTFMSGPFGLLLYLIFQGTKNKNFLKTPFGHS